MRSAQPCIVCGRDDTIIFASRTDARSSSPFPSEMLIAGNAACAIFSAPSTTPACAPAQLPETARHTAEPRRLDCPSRWRSHWRERYENVERAGRDALDLVCVKRRLSERLSASSSITDVSEQKKRDEQLQTRSRAGRTDRRDPRRPAQSRSASRIATSTTSPSTRPSAPIHDLVAGRDPRSFGLGSGRQRSLPSASSSPIGACWKPATPSFGSGAYRPRRRQRPLGRHPQVSRRHAGPPFRRHLHERRHRYRRLVRRLRRWCGDIRRLADQRLQHLYAAPRISTIRSASLDMQQLVECRIDDRALLPARGLRVSAGDRRPAETEDRLVCASARLGPRSLCGPQRRGADRLRHGRRSARHGARHSAARWRFSGWAAYVRAAWRTCPVVTASKPITDAADLADGDLRRLCRAPARFAAAAIGLVGSAFEADGITASVPDFAGGRRPRGRRQPDQPVRLRADPGRARRLPPDRRQRSTRPCDLWHELQPAPGPDGRFHAGHERLRCGAIAIRTGGKATRAVRTPIVAVTAQALDIDLEQLQERRAWMITS